MSVYTNLIKSLANNKYINTYLKICEQARVRASSRAQAKILFEYTEEHHIVPRSFNLGGEKDPLNYSYLTAREHFICHKLLVKGLHLTKYYWKCLRTGGII